VGTTLQDNSSSDLTWQSIHFHIVDRFIGAVSSHDGVIRADNSDLDVVAPDYVKSSCAFNFRDTTTKICKVP